MSTRPQASRRGRDGGALLLAAAALTTLAACNAHPLDPVEYEQIGIDDETVALVVNRNVDVLFVMDNSGSMGEEQATLAANFERFINELEHPNVKADYRIGITTTDNGLCNGTTPEGGKLVLSSCRSRTQDFVFTGDEPVDATDEACLSICPEEWSSIETLPTQIDDDREAKPRPWIESIDGVTNLPEGLDTVQAFQCLGPQGVNGCGFEEHLEATRRALVRATTDTEDSYGFMRDDSILAIVYVTDEEDCSINGDFADVLSPDGDRTFWSDPTAGNATSAVCWNAGVECTGSGDSYECHSVDRGIDGSIVAEGDAEDDAVVRPVSRYVDFLQAVEEQKQRLAPDREVLVAVIGGVGDDGEPTYANTTTDPKFQDDFGIGPGCLSSAGEAVPPVRLAELADAFVVDDQQNMFSVCSSDYSESLGQIAAAIAEQVRPPCMTRCVADSDPTTEVLEPHCTLEQEVPTRDGGVETTTVRQCNADGTLPSDDVDVCYVAKVDGALDATGEGRTFTPDDASDDLSPDCREEGWNLEFELVRREGTRAPGGTSVKATCALSQQRQIDCPQLH